MGMGWLLAGWGGLGRPPSREIKALRVRVAESGRFKAERPNMAYYVSLTVGKAKVHSDAKRKEAARKPEPAPERKAAESAEANVKHGRPSEESDHLVSVAEVQRMIASAPEAKFPEQSLLQKKCKTCSLSKARACFASSQWALKNPKCLECKPVSDSLRKRLLSEKKCAVCGVVFDRDNFTLTQWKAGAAAKCKSCVSKDTGSRPKLLKTCVTCNERKAKAEFSTTQWQQREAVGSR